MKDISQLYGEAPGSLFEDYIHPELELMSQASDWRQLLDILEAEERRAIRYYFQARRGEGAFSTRWIERIEKAIALINEHCWKQINQRLAVYDQIKSLYWASLSGVDSKGRPISYWCKSRQRCLIFLENDRKWLSQLCDRSNKKIGHRRFLVITVDATNRLKLEKPS